MAVDGLTEIAYYDEQATNVFTVVSSATPTVNVDQFGVLKVTALAVAITGIVASSTSGNGPVDFQKLVVRLLDNGVARAITWSSSFEPVGAALPSTTVAGKRHTLTFLYSTDSAKWGLVDAKVEA